MHNRHGVRHSETATDQADSLDDIHVTERR